MAKNNIVWLVALAAVLALVYYLYEGGKFSEGSGTGWCGPQCQEVIAGARTDGVKHQFSPGSAPRTPSAATKEGEGSDLQCCTPNPRACHGWEPGGVKRCKVCCDIHLCPGCGIALGNSNDPS